MTTLFALLTQRSAGELLAQGILLPDPDADDLRRLTPGSVPALSEPPGRLLVAQVGEESLAIPIVLELSVEHPPEGGLLNAYVPLRSISLDHARAFHFRSDEERFEFMARTYVNYDVPFDRLATSPKLFEGAAEPLALPKRRAPKTSLQPGSLDALAGALCLAEEVDRGGEARECLAHGRGEGWAPSLHRMLLRNEAAPADDAARYLFLRIACFAASRRAGQSFDAAAALRLPAIKAPLTAEAREETKGLVGRLRALLSHRTTLDELVDAPLAQAAGAFLVNPILGMMEGMDRLSPDARVPAAVLLGLHQGLRALPSEIKAERLARLGSWQAALWLGPEAGIFSTVVAEPQAVNPPKGSDPLEALLSADLGREPWRSVAIQVCKEMGWRYYRLDVDLSQADFRLVSRGGRTSLQVVGTTAESLAASVVIDQEALKGQLRAERPNEELRARAEAILERIDLPDPRLEG